MCIWPPQALHVLPLLPTSELLLPVHLVEEVLCSQEEVVDLAALLVSLRRVVDSQLRLRGQELADVGHREHYLLHGAVLAHNLNRETRSHPRGGETSASVGPHGAHSLTISLQIHSRHLAFYMINLFFEIL